MNPAGQPLHINHLIHETSPYLLQHAHNPVDWYPWGEEALQRAKDEDKPIFLSIGYSACHWCHVMAHESFENEAIAAVMNEHFINVKVDREERPDLDEIYMNAVIALSGSGGWPMSVFLTPDLKPFYGGTYYPPDDRYGRAGFPTVLKGVADAWENRREEVLQGAGQLTAHITQQMSTAPAAEGELTQALLDGAIKQLHASYDAEEGGWGHAPKFPSSASIHFALRAWNRSGDPATLAMATKTLDAMARGGMYDQLGGGFHRYSVDGQWLVPHFEKMLYDNAQLAPAYMEAWQATQNPYYRRIAIEILDYELRDMRDERGAFHSAEDADSEGEEGKFYIWTKGEIVAALGEADAAIFCAYYNVKDGGNFSSHEYYHAGQNILHMTQSAAAIAADLGMDEAALEKRMAPLRAQLLAIRAKRVRPGLDDKVLTAWNAMMITALARGARVLDEPRYATAAVEAGTFLLMHMLREDGTLLRTHRHGESRLPGYLDDYASTANAFVDLYETTFDLKWLAAADRIVQSMHARFWDETTGNYFYTGEDHQNLIVRTKPTYDGAEPSGNATAAMALLRLSKLIDNREYHERAGRILAASRGEMSRAPQGYLRMLLATDFLLHPPREIAVAGALDDPATQALLRALHATFVPNQVLAHIDPGADDAADRIARVPLLAHKERVGGKPAAYVCKNFTCKLPVTEAAALIAELAKD